MCMYALNVYLYILRNATIEKKKLKKKGGYRDRDRNVYPLKVKDKLSYLFYK